MSRKGMEPSGLDSSFVNWMWWSIELRWFRKHSICDDLMMGSVSLYIRVNNTSLNRNIGKYHLPHIWNEVLLNTSELKLK